MKRQPENTESLGYAYGCGRPHSGVEHAEREACRMLAMWNRLVDVDRAVEREQEEACARDVPEAADTIAQIGAVTAEIGVASEKKALNELYERRRTLRRELARLVAQWRRTHQDAARGIEARRRAAVVRVRQDYTVASDDPLYWANSNAIIQRYDAARRSAQQFGRRLRTTALAICA